MSLFEILTLLIALPVVLTLLYGTVRFYRDDDGVARQKRRPSATPKMPQVVSA